jgi:hypothetical protein
MFNPKGSRTLEKLNDCFFCGLSIANSCEFLCVRGSYFSWDSNDNPIEIF